MWFFFLMCPFLCVCVGRLMRSYVNCKSFSGRDYRSLLKRKWKRLMMTYGEQYWSQNFSFNWSDKKSFDLSWMVSSQHSIGHQNVRDSLNLCNVCSSSEFLFCISLVGISYMPDIHRSDINRSSGNLMGSDWRILTLDCLIYDLL